MMNIYLHTNDHIFCCRDSVYKCQYLRQILCILIYILMVLKLDNSSNCVDTSLVGNVTGSGALSSAWETSMFVVLNVLCDARDVTLPAPLDDIFPILQLALQLSGLEMASQLLCI